MITATQAIAWFKSTSAIYIKETMHNYLNLKFKVNSGIKHWNLVKAS